MKLLQNILSNVSALSIMFQTGVAIVLIKNTLPCQTHAVRVHSRVQASTSEYSHRIPLITRSTHVEALNGSYSVDM